MEIGSGSEAVSGANGSMDSLDGLKFGKKIYFEDVGSSSSSNGGSGARATSLPPAKKGKGAVVQQQQQHTPRCQVEGCNVDLSGAKAYYCRHKVCGMHSKSPKVVVAGIEQRFCQQCSRFHQLHEFDQGKRSCRRRLAGHNERRRKPPPGPLSPRYGRLASSFYEDNSRFRSFLMDFSYPKIQSPSQDLWPTARSSDHAPNGGYQWQGIPNTASNVVMTHPCSIHPSSHYSSQVPPGELFYSEGSDSSCALSLLSTQPWGNTTTSQRSRTPNISSSSNFRDAPMGPQMSGTISSNCVVHPWGFKNHGPNSSTNHLTQLDMGLGHLDDDDDDDGNGQFTGELELALQGNKYCPEHGHLQAYDHSGNGVHWSL